MTAKNDRLTLGNRLTVGQAAKLLKVTPQTIRNRIERGELAAEKEVLSDDGRWEYRIDSRQITSYLAANESPKDVWESEEIYPLVETLALALKPVLEVQANSQSEAIAALKEQLEAERDHAKSERERAERLEAEAKELREKLEKAHQRPWWRRVFGR